MKKFWHSFHKAAEQYTQDSEYVKELIAQMEMVVQKSIIRMKDTMPFNKNYPMLRL